jgi:hypothetical protein
MGTEPLISLGKAAKEVGINKSTLSRQIKAGSIRSHDGKVRLSEVLEDRANNIATAIRDVAKAPVAPANPIPLHDATADDATEGETGTVIIDGKTLEINAAKALKETYLGRLAQLKFEQESGNLVQADIVHKAVFDLFRRNRDSWSNWTAQVSPMIAAALGVDQVKLAVVMEEYVRKQLAEHSKWALRLPGA